jgi:uncharacterized protein (TIGR03437 family)
MPLAGVIQATDGNLYGTTSSCGVSNYGTVFRMTPAGALTTIHQFSGDDGLDPYGTLLQASDGSLYGTTIGGGLHKNGTIFRITLAGVFASVYSFNVSDGAGPNAGLIQAKDGAFYGTAIGGGAKNYGAVFQFNAASGTLTTLHSFALTDGERPIGGLIQANDGSFYGTTSLGGASFGGTVFRLTLTPASVPAPTITPNGIVPIYSSSTTIQSGEWVSIYGSNLAGGTTSWKGDFPTTLGNTSVTVNGKPAYLSLTSPGQINLQVPTDTGLGTVAVVVTTSGGSATAMVTLGAVAPAFLLLDSKHVAGIILRSNGSGAYGGGTYDIIGPQVSTLGYPVVPAAEGDTIELFAAGLGPTNPSVTAGQPYSGAAATTNSVTVQINNVPVPLGFAGLSGAGLYQINLIVPAGLGLGDVPLALSVGGAHAQSGVVLSVGAPH